MNEYIEFEVRNHNFMVFGIQIIGDTVRNIMPLYYELDPSRDWHERDAEDFKGKVYKFAIHRIEKDRQYLLWR